MPLLLLIWRVARKGEERGGEEEERGRELLSRKRRDTSPTVLGRERRRGR